MKVSIFSTCLVDMMFPQVGIATVELLEHLGCETDFPEKQVCCGQPTYNSGYFKDAKKAMKNMIEAFEESDYVVGPSGSCVAMLREYPKAFKDDPEWFPRANRLAKKSYEITQFIVRVLGVTDVGATFNGVATYHRSCHMTRLLKEAEAPFLLLENVKGLTMRPLNHIESCCGFGGTFSVKMPEISEQLVQDKVAAVAETGADVLISADMGCLMNIGGKITRTGKEIKIMHIAEILNHRVKEEATIK
ncbi:(Fe-S)-binding protein [Listeria sp. PSOL-1]|uniref:(Fe-S)-binding protein n=1 Tax=Listeria sp. PSOL-1 TaxID=1844999 RepID=UPI0013D89FDF|nr:(Fe-S)-binding protein [Listeria sp. PSOL-1]